MFSVNKPSYRDGPMMSLIQCLFFLEAWFGFEIVASHLPGRENTLVDDLSPNRRSVFLSKAHCPDEAPTDLPPELPGLLLSRGGLDISKLDGSVLLYSSRGVADSTRRTYQSGLRRYLSFCYAFGVPAPFPVAETLLCYFVTSLAQEGVAPSTIRTYLPTWRRCGTPR